MPLKLQRWSATRPFARRRGALGAVIPILALGLAAAAAAKAQVSVSGSLTSDYQYRGVSLSDGKPALSLSIAYDHDTGGYAGASAIAEDTATEGLQMLGFVEYIGYSRRLTSGITGDLGVTNLNIDKYYDQRYRFHYTEAYAGLATEHFRYYVYYSRNYFGRGLSTIYIDVSGGFRPARRWRLFGHAGVLSAFGGSDRSVSAYEQYDFRAGVAREFKHAEIQLLWTTVGGGAEYLAGQRQSRPALVLGATCFF